MRNTVTVFLVPDVIESGMARAIFRTRVVLLFDTSLRLGIIFISHPGYAMSCLTLFGTLDSFLVRTALKPPLHRGIEIIAVTPMPSLL
uniref:Uncharacterized protein n=1 Tax=Timema douglasi TaxID=61478 RepID=A0A7R8ZBG9_TIMDO|nr:unnamed protein product [Timema douglasi]